MYIICQTQENQKKNNNKPMTHEILLWEPKDCSEIKATKQYFKFIYQLCKLMSSKMAFKYFFLLFSEQGFMYEIEIYTLSNSLRFREKKYYDIRRCNIYFQG